MEITYFPIEVLQAILMLLDFRDVVRCRQVIEFKTLHSLCNDEAHP